MAGIEPYKKLMKAGKSIFDAEFTDHMAKRIPGDSVADKISRKKLNGKTAAAGAGTAAGLGLSGTAQAPTAEAEAKPEPAKAAPEIEDKNKTTSEFKSDAVDQVKEAIKRQYPMPAKGKSFQFKEKDFSEELGKDLEKVTSEYDKALSGLKDEERADQERIAMKSILKGLVDAAALMYLAKHAPTAEYQKIDDQEAYNRDLDRLERHMNAQRSLVRAKFDELRSATKDKYKTMERREGRKREDALQQHRDDQRFAEDLHRAKVDEFKMDERRELDKQRMDAKAAAGSAKPPITLNQMATLDNRNQKKLEEFRIKGLEEDDELQEAELRNMGATDSEISEFLEAKNKGWFSSPEEALKFLPSSAQLTRRQLSNFGESEEPTDGPVRMQAPDGRILMVPANKVTEMESKGAKRL
jgi:hypothetical protein